MQSIFKSLTFTAVVLSFSACSAQFGIHSPNASLADNAPPVARPAPHPSISPSGSPSPLPSEQPTPVPSVQPSASPSSSPTESPTPRPTFTLPANTVCDPFTDPGSLDPSYGIHGSIHYLTSDQPHYRSALDYLHFGHDEGVDLYLNSINVPTRNFRQGFQTHSGLQLTLPDGAPLIEYFSVHADTELALASGDAPGDYQLAMLSDDGSLLTPSGAPQPLVDDDGVHATKMECATTPVHFADANSTYPVHLDYFQGPRYSIAWVILWRPWPSNPAEVRDPLCGKWDTTSFFNPATSPSTPGPDYLALVRRGWKPPTSANYKLQSGSNPCR